MSDSTIPVGITCGDPAGVGPEIAIRAAAERCASDALVLYGDAGRLLALASAHGVSDRFERGEIDHACAGRVSVVHVAEWSDAAMASGPSAAGGEAQFLCIERAVTDALEGRIRAIATGPMSKAAVNMTGRDFMGHTEYLAQRSELADDGVTMMFLGPRLRVSLVTTHVSLRRAPDEITAERVERAALHLGEALVRLDGPGFARGRRVQVAGLNPHAGEGGLFGDEEIREIAPGTVRAARQSPYVDVLELEGPIPAETSIRLAAQGKIAGVVAMIHDQATIPSKALDWGDAVNVTWGLPFVRTSVDHGVGYDAVANGAADASGMRAAIEMAQQLTR